MPRMKVKDLRALGLTVADAKPTRPKRTDGYASQLECDYAKHLMDTSVKFWYEAVTLQVGIDRRFTPDFMIVNLVGRIEGSTGLGRTPRFALSIEFREVKCRQHAWARRGINALHTAALLYPFFRWTLVTRDKATKAWVHEEIGGKT